MKSLVHRLHKVADAVFEDACLAYPYLEREFERDKLRFASLVEHHGLGFFTLVLPALDPVLLQGLETGRLICSGPLTRRVSKLTHVPSFLRGLWLRVFDKSGSLLPDPDTTAVLFLRQIFCLGKKIEVKCTPERQELAIKEFSNVEATMRQATLGWSNTYLVESGDRYAHPTFVGWVRDGHEDSLPLIEGDRVGVPDVSSDFLRRLDSICRDVATSFGMFEPIAYECELRARTPLREGAKHGPGAVSDRRASEDKYPFVHWPEKLDYVFPFDYFGGQKLAERETTHVNHEHFSKLIAVPKTAKTPRLIAAEPSYHQWCQQLIKEFLVDRTDSVIGRDFIAFDDQSLSQDLVRQSSLHGELATVDLSSASDRLSCWAIERAWSANLSILQAFHSVRTRGICGSKTADIEPLFLKKFSTMGSALTFPVQTLFFLCVVLATLPGPSRLDQALKAWRGKVRVFGDDIILPKIGYADLVKNLSFLGLRVNEAKCFAHGQFRESCGMDALRGDSVTPLKPKSLDPTTPVGRNSMVDLANNLHNAGFWRAGRAVCSMLPAASSKLLRVVSRFSGAFGMTSFSGDDVSHLKSRWNSALQRSEVRVLSYTSKAHTNYAEGTDYLFQVLHSMRTRNYRDTGLLQPGLLGRVVKSTTRESRRWEVSVSGPVALEKR